MRRSSPPFKRKHASIVLPQLIIPSESAIASACLPSVITDPSTRNIPATKPNHTSPTSRQPIETPSCSSNGSDYISEDSPYPHEQNDSRKSSLNSNNSGSVFDSVSGSDATSLLPPRNKSILCSRSPRLEFDYFTRRVSPFNGGTFTDSYICEKKLPVVLGFEPMTNLGLDENEWNEPVVPGMSNNKSVSFGTTTVFPMEMEVELEHMEHVMFEGKRSHVPSADRSGGDGGDEGVGEGIDMGNISGFDTRSFGDSAAISDEEAF
ncbi:hypothetical protein ACMFMG_008487 [Clarireedia jacksonii]